MIEVSAYRDLQDVISSTADQARGMEELILALMESPDPCDKALNVLYMASQRLADDLEAVKAPKIVRKAS